MEKLRQNTRKITYAIFFSISSVICFYLIFLLIGVNRESFLMQVLSSLSEFFGSPFIGTVSKSYLNVFRGIINPDYIIAIFGYLFGAIVIGEILTAFMYERIRDIIQNFVDAMFKFIELLLLIRIGMDLFGSTVTKVSPPLIQFIYSVTNWSVGLFPKVVFLGLAINISAILYLLIIVFIDTQFEKILDALFNLFNFGNKKVNLVKPVTKITQKVIYITNPKRIIKIRIPRQKIVVSENLGDNVSSEKEQIKQKFISDSR